MSFWGGGPLSWMRYLSFWSFRKQNPDWEIRLFVAPACKNQATWEGHEVADFQSPVGRDYLTKLPALGVKIEGWNPPADFANAAPSHMADLCRWGALSQFGGWFADTDFLWLDPMSLCLQHYEGQDVAFPVCRDRLAVGMIGAKARTKFTGELYIAARNTADFRRFASAGSENLARMIGCDPIYTEQRTIQRAIKAKWPDVSFWFPHHAAFYTWNWYDAPRIFVQDDPALNYTVGLHWTGSTRAAQRANRLYDETNFRQYRNTFTHFAANLIDGTEE